MSDIVERLRLREHDHSECIAEIERLRAALYEIQDPQHRPCPWCQEKARRALAGERAQVQASLKMTNGGERQLSAYLKLEAEIERLRAENLELEQRNIALQTEIANLEERLFEGEQHDDA